MEVNPDGSGPFTRVTLRPQTARHDHAGATVACCSRPEHYRQAAFPAPGVVVILCSISLVLFVRETFPAERVAVHLDPFRRALGRAAIWLAGIVAGPLSAAECRITFR